MKSIVKKSIILCMTIIFLGTNTISSKAYGGNIGKKIDSSTFGSNYNITSIHVGSDVYEITATAFRNLINLRSITVSSNNPEYASYSGCLYDKDFTELLCFPPALSGAYIPESVVSIGTYALHGVPENLKEGIRDAVNSHAAENGLDWDIPGEHFVHVDGIVKWKKADGSVIFPNSELMGLVASIVNDCTTGGMKRSQQIESCFNYVVTILSYERSMEVPSGDWTSVYAENALITGKANCYGYAAVFAYVAKGLGYEARVCTGTIKSSLGGRTAHAWTEVKIGSKWYVFDTEMQDAKGSGYYKVTYDQYPAGPIEKTGSFSVSF
jgi:hypothetical protein